MEELILYSDLIGEYLLLDYFPTHGELLLRRKKDKTSMNNIDIVFKQVRLLFLPDRLQGIELASITHLSSNHSKELGLTLKYGYKIFQLKDKEGHIFYINAGAVGRFHNDFPLLESSLGEKLVSELNTCIFWFKG